MVSWLAFLFSLAACAVAALALFRGRAFNYQVSLPGVRREVAGLEWLPRARG